MNRTATLIVATLLAAPGLIHADTVRGTLAGKLTVQADQQGSGEALVGIDDLLGVDLAGDSRFFKGIEVAITIPREVRRFRDLLALFIYTNVKPEPSKQVSRYTGTQAGFVVLPPTAKAYVNIPLANNSIEPSAETITLPVAIAPDQFPIILAVLPLEKGIPGSIEASQFTISASPILRNEGLLKLTINEGGSPPTLPFDLSIDDQPELFPQPDGYILPTGLHHLRITSDNYTEQFQTFGIDQGATTKVNLTLVRPVPKLIFEVPDIAAVYLDGQLLSPPPRTPIVVKEGSHVIQFKLGNYSLTKTITAEKGKTYKITLFLDISVQEN